MKNEFNHSGVVLSKIGDREGLVLITQNGCSNTRMVVLEIHDVQQAESGFEQTKINGPWFKMVSFTATSAWNCGVDTRG